MKQIRKIIKVGNSFGITLPKDFIEGYQLHEGDLLSCELEVIRKKEVGKDGERSL
jgi:antitoxin component of MazEF toxin-antitoxin module